MIGHAVIVVGIEFELLLLVPAQNTAYLIGATAVSYKLAVNGKELLTMPYILIISKIKITFSKREIMNGIEQIGFSNAVQTGKAVNLLRKHQRYIAVVFKIIQGYFPEIHLLLFCEKVFNVSGNSLHKPLRC
jgi:hypothetical protein